MQKYHQINKVPQKILIKMLQLLTNLVDNNSRALDKLNFNK